MLVVNIKLKMMSVFLFEDMTPDIIGGLHNIKNQCLTKVFHPFYRFVLWFVIIL